MTKQLSKTLAACAAAALLAFPALAAEPDYSAEIAYADEVFALTNAEREKAGLAPLARDGLLDEAAMFRAAEVKAVDAAGGKAHTRPDGSSFRSAIDSLGVDGMKCGENLARTRATPGSVMDTWMASEGHRANILRPDYGSIGIGAYQRSDGRLDWIQIFMLQ